jgi:DNA processing protein
MDHFPLQSIHTFDFFPDLREVPEPPDTLSLRGTLEKTIGTTFLTVVGSRKHSRYGAEVCRALIEGLKGYPITVVSGLALGIDALAHEAALTAGLPTIAFPGSGLGTDVLYPQQHYGLAQRILEHGGALLSEYPEHFRATYWSFPRRNRLEAGIAPLTLVIEAEEKSGTLITARLATEYNRTVGAVPGPITSPTSRGANWLISLGAVPITTSADIIRELSLPTPAPAALDLILNEDESRMLGLLREPRTRAELIDLLELDPLRASSVFATLEIKGVIRETLGFIERV